MAGPTYNKMKVKVKLLDPLDMFFFLGGGGGALCICISYILLCGKVLDIVGRND